MSEPKLKGYTELKQPAAMSEEGNMAANWREWKRSFDYYMIATGKENAASREKCALFLHVIGKGNREILNELDLDNEAQDDYAKLVSKFEQHYDPPPNVNNERLTFFDTYQREDSFDEYFNKLKLKSRFCEFGQIRRSLILTQIIRGLKDTKLRERLLAKSKLDLEEAVSWCRTVESTSQQTYFVSQQMESVSLKKNILNQLKNSDRQKAESASQKAEPSISNVERVSQLAEYASQQAKSDSQRTKRASQHAETASQQIKCGSHKVESAKLKAAGSQQPPSRLPALPYFQPVSTISLCDYCGRYHGVGDKCLAWDAICYRCEHVGHFARMCRDL